MKMKLYYVVRSCGRDNVEYIAGPFSYDGVNEYLSRTFEGYLLVEQEIEVS